MVETRERRGRRHQLRRRAVLDAAAAEFAAVGYETATLDDIGSRLGLSKAGLYYYVDGKERLLIDLAEDAVARVEQTLDLLPDDTTVTARLHAFISAHVATAFHTPAGRVLSKNLERLLSVDGAREVRDRYEGLLARILRTGIQTGEFVDIDPAILGRMLLAAMNAAPRWFDPDGEKSVEDLVDVTTRTLLYGITRTGPIV